MVQLEVHSCPSSCTHMALANILPVNPNDHRLLGDYVEICGVVFLVQPTADLQSGRIGFNAIQRNSLQLQLKSVITVTAFRPPRDSYLHSLELEIDFLNQNHVTKEPFTSETLRKSMKLFEKQFMTVSQAFLLDVCGVRMMAKVMKVEVLDSEKLKKGAEVSLNAKRGILVDATTIIFSKGMGSQLNIQGGAAAGAATAGIVRADWDFENMGIGGMDREFRDIMRRAFASRMFSPEVMAKLGVKHVKGILLYGPPGTGKTLMARQIGKMLNTREPKIVHGPEILNKYVGQSEENIRALFKEAEDEYKQQGDNSELHIIIFDEIDSICRARGSTGGGTGVQDTVVNQLLSKIDGVQSLNNILIIGMTNRKDMIDEALLRPGRLEVHMEISLPDEAGRLQIFRIHTTKMRDENFVAPDVNLEELAARTKNYTGAEIEAVVKGATSFALYRQVDLKKVGRQQTDLSSPVTKEDFLRALDENQPAFGMTSDEFDSCAPNGIINFGTKFARLQESLGMFVEQVRNSEKTPLVSVLLEGKIGTGKTALASTIAESSEFPYVKMVSPEKMVGQSEAGKCAKIAKIFADSYKSPLSMIVVDNIERLLEYVQMGPRFSNTILQTLMVLIKKTPPKGHKLLIVGTTSQPKVIEHMGLNACFNATLTMPAVCAGDEVASVLSSLGYFSSQDVKALKNSVYEEIPIKQLLLVSDLAKQSASPSEPLAHRFVQCLESFAGGNGI